MLTMLTMCAFLGCAQGAMPPLEAKANNARPSYVYTPPPGKKYPQPRSACPMRRPWCGR